MNPWPIGPDPVVTPLFVDYLGRLVLRERTEDSELYRTRIETLGVCRYFQPVLADLHANTDETMVRSAALRLFEQPDSDKPLGGAHCRSN